MAIAAGPHVFVNGNELAAEAQMRDDRTFLPLRAIFEALGFDVDWDQETQTAIAGDRPDVLPARRDDGVINIVVNGNVVVSDVDPFVEYPGVTYVPVRFVSENAGLSVEWCEDTRSVFVGTPPAVNGSGGFEDGEMNDAVQTPHLDGVVIDAGIRVTLTRPTIVYDEMINEIGFWEAGTSLPLSNFQSPYRIVVFYQGSAYSIFGEFWVIETQ